MTIANGRTEATATGPYFVAIQTFSPMGGPVGAWAYPNFTLAQVTDAILWKPQSDGQPSGTMAYDYASAESRDLVRIIPSNPSLNGQLVDVVIPLGSCFAGVLTSFNCSSRDATCTYGPLVNGTAAASYEVRANGGPVAVGRAEASSLCVPVGGGSFAFECPSRAGTNPASLRIQLLLSSQYELVASASTLALLQPSNFRGSGLATVSAAATATTPTITEVYLAGTTTPVSFTISSAMNNNYGLPVDPRIGIGSPCRPALTLQPINAFAPSGGSFTLQISATAPPDGGPLTYIWSRGVAVLTDGPTVNGSTVSGSNSGSLQITNVSPFDAGAYEVFVLNSCGVVLSATAVVTVTCPADFNADTFVDDTDFVLFTQQYAVFDCADPAMPDACSADLNADSFVDDTDFVIFTQAYEQFTCP